MIRPILMSFAGWLNFAKAQKYSARFGLIFWTYSHRHSAQSVAFIVVYCLVIISSHKQHPCLFVVRNTLHVHINLASVLVRGIFVVVVKDADAPSFVIPITNQHSVTLLERALLLLLLRE